MRNNKRFTRRRWSLLVASAALFGLSMASLYVAQAHAAINKIPTPTPKSNSYGLEATKRQPPPQTPPTVSTPGDGSNTSNSTITVSGICIDGLLVQVYDNGALVGAIDCKGGSFSIQVSLFPGKNDITSIQFDDLDQGSPVSNTVSVEYVVNVASNSYLPAMTLTSNYGRRAANPGATLTWPLELSGGVGPYAFSIDWGDGTAPELKSQSSAGVINISHVYKQAGLYHLTVKVTDVNGQTAFIQLVAIANGTPQAAATATKDEGAKTIVRVLWIPTIVLLLLLIPAFWLGRRSMVISLRRKLEKEMEQYKEL